MPCSFRGLRHPFVHLSGPGRGFEAGMGWQAGPILCCRFRGCGISSQESPDIRVGLTDKESSQTAGSTRSGV